MKFAIFRLIGISLVSVLILSGVLFLLRTLGLTQKHSPLKHPLLISYKNFNFYDFVPSRSHPNPPPHIKKALLNLNLWVTKDLHYVLFSQSGKLQDNSFIFQKDKAELKTQGLLELKEFLSKFYTSPVLLSIYEQDPAKLVSFKQTIQQLKYDKKIILHSPYPKTLEFLRKENPLWLFGSPMNLQTQLLFLSALYIEPMANIKADFIITPFSHKGLPLVNPRIRKELQRRHIRLIIERNHPETLPPWVQPDGFLYRKPSS